ncbi:MAG: hypothetical protein AABY27_03985 [Pseudomonadota bacterium]
MSENEQKSNSGNKVLNKNILLGLVILVTLAIAGFLYFDFSQKVSPPVNKEIKASSLKDNAKPKEQEENPVVNEKRIKIESKIACNELVQFMQEYYQMKVIANSGEDFTGELVELKKFKIKFNEIDEILTQLEGLAKHNKTNEYYKKLLNDITRDIYSCNFPYLKNMIFIRPIGQRAIDNGGIDQEIVMIEKYLADNDITSAISSIEKIKDEKNRFETLKIELDCKAKIMSYISMLDQIINTRLSCEVIGK